MNLRKGENWVPIIMITRSKVDAKGKEIVMWSQIGYCSMLLKIMNSFSTAQETMLIYLVDIGTGTE